MSNNLLPEERYQEEKSVVLKMGMLEHVVNDLVVVLETCRDAMYGESEDKYFNRYKMELTGRIISRIQSQVDFEWVNVGELIHYPEGTVKHEGYEWYIEREDRI